MSRGSVLVFATKGAGSNEEARIRALASQHGCDVFPFDRGQKLLSMIRLLRQARRERPGLVIMEGTGLAGGMACLVGRALFGSRYVVSSGDAVGPWVGIRMPVARPAFALYERALCRFASGFIGWTPYLVGRALTFGTPRAMTAAGWAEFQYHPDAFAVSRARVRSRLGIPADALVFGVVGSLVWSRRHRYCYGAELVRAIRRVSREKGSRPVVLVVGGGSGLERLKELAGDDLGRRVFLAGEAPANEVAEYMSAMDVASLPQSVDGVGSFRYTTKISEYVTARLPMVTGEVPLSYDLDVGWLWRLPGDAPWASRYIDVLAALMEQVTPAQVTAKRDALPAKLQEFDRESQVVRVTAFIRDLLDAQ